MQELHVKSLLPVRLDKFLMEQFPALGLGRLNKACLLYTSPSPRDCS